MVRRPVVSGMFYEAEKKALLRQVEGQFRSPLGPGSTRDTKKKNVLGVISPHAGYAFSGPCAAWSYKEINSSEKPDTFLILSPNHTGMGRTSLITEPYQTPIGEVGIDKDLAKLLLNDTNHILDDIGSHMNEHSLEVQLPFLQYLYKDVKILPIVISSLINVKEISHSIRDTLSNYNKKVSIIASSDFTHYGPNYDYVPFQNDIKENIRKLDMGAIDLIKDMDYNGFLEYVEDNNATICGILPISMMMRILQGKVKKVELLKYYTSSDIMPDKTNSVSYASIAFYG